MRHLLKHTAQVKRQVPSVSGDGKTTTALQTVLSSLKCLVEGLKGEARNSQIGRIEGAAYTFTWCDTPLKDGDIIVWNNRQFHLRGILDDTTRGRLAYYTGVLAERNR